MKNLKELELFSERIPTKEGEHMYDRDYFVKPDISPYLVYTILKENFGASNSDFFDEGKTQWQWLFKYKDFYIEIYDWKLLSTSIGIYHEDSDQIKSEKLGSEINALLSKIAQQKRSILKTKAKNCKHKLLENPFVIYYSTADNLLSVAKTIDELIKIHSEISIDTFDLREKKSDLYRSAFLMLLSSFEGFMNILYELYLKTELRTDRLYERISREQVDIKLRIAPIYCDGFKAKTINHEDERFKNYLRLVNLRNDYVHANLIKSLERYIVSEDKHTFIIENEENSNIPTNITQLELKHVELAQKTIDDVVELVFEAMEPKTKREFKRIIYNSEIEVEENDGILIPN